jgi:non-homologous end joining protein Ku
MRRTPLHYGTALKELVQEKMKGHKVVAKEAERPSGGNIVDLMETLTRSIGDAGSGKDKSARGGKKRA